MKPRNKRIYNLNQEVLVTLREEYIMLGFDTSIEPGCLTIYARKRKKKKEDKEKRERNKRSEKFERRS